MAQLALFRLEIGLINCQYFILISAVSTHLKSKVFGLIWLWIYLTIYKDIFVCLKIQIVFRYTIVIQSIIWIAKLYFDSTDLDQFKRCQHIYFSLRPAWNKDVESLTL